MSVPTKQDVDKLYKEMIDASVQVADLDQDVQSFQNRNGSGLGPLMRGWTDAASALIRQLTRSEADLLNAGTPRALIASLEKRLEDLEDSARTLDLQSELDDCVDSWNSLSQDLSRLEGTAGTSLHALLDSRRAQIDDITDKLGFARNNGGMAPEVYERWRKLVAQRDAARALYEKLRRKYLAAAFKLREWEWEQSILRARDNDRPYDGSYLVQTPVGQLRITNSQPAHSLRGPGGAPPRPSQQLLKLPDPKKLVAGKTSAGLPKAPPHLSHQPNAPRLSQPRAVQQLQAPVKQHEQVTTLHKPAPAGLKKPLHADPVKPGHQWGSVAAKKPAALSKPHPHLKAPEPKSPRIFKPAPRPELAPRHEQPKLHEQPQHARPAAKKPDPKQALKKPGEKHDPKKPEHKHEAKKPAPRHELHKPEHHDPKAPRIFKPAPRPELAPKHEAHKAEAKKPEAHKHAQHKAEPKKPEAPHLHKPLHGHEAHKTDPKAPRIFKPAPRPELAPKHEQKQLEAKAALKKQPFLWKPEPKKPEAKKPEHHLPRPEHGAALKPDAPHKVLQHKPKLTPNHPEAKHVYAPSDPAKKTPLRISKAPPRPEHAPRHEASKHQPEKKLAVAAPRPAHPARVLHAPRNLAPRVSVEKLERVVPWPEGIDGIGRGNQTAHAYFTAQGIDGALSVSGTTQIALDCGVSMLVAPSLHLLSGAPGSVMHGRLSLSIASPGGRLGLSQPRSAASKSRRAARSAASSVAAKLGKFGPGLQSAISDLLGDAAEKLFAEAHYQPRPAHTHQTPAHPNHPEHPAPHHAQPAHHGTAAHHPRHRRHHGKHEAHEAPAGPHEPGHHGQENHAHNQHHHKPHHEAQHHGHQQHHPRHHQPRHGAQHGAPHHLAHHAQKHHHALNLHFKDLGHLLEEFRKHGHQKQHRAGQGLHHLIEHERARDGVAQRLARTMHGLAHEAHALTHAAAGDMRAQVARMDAIMAKLRGKTGKELLHGAHEIGHALGELGHLAGTEQGARHAGHIKKLLHERKGELAHIAGAVTGHGAGATALKLPGLLSQPRAGAHASLDLLRKLHPGLDKLLSKSAHEHLGHELGHGKLRGGHALHAAHGRPAHHGGLQALHGKPGPHGKPAHHEAHGFGGGFAAGMLGGAHLGGFGGGASGALAALGHKGALEHLVKKIEVEIHRTPPQLLGALLKKIQSGEHHAIKTIAHLAERKQRQGVAHHDPLGRHWPHAPQPAKGKSGVKRKHGAHRVSLHSLSATLKEQGHGAFASHLAPGGKLHALVEAAQRGHGKGIAAVAQHAMHLGGHGNLSAAMQTVHKLQKQGYKPHRSWFGNVMDRIKDTASSAITKVTSTVTKVTALAQTAVQTVAPGISSFVSRAAGAVGSIVKSGVGMAKKWAPKAFSFAKKAMSFTPLGLGMSLMNKVLHNKGGLGGVWSSLKKGASNLAHAVAAPAKGLFDRAVSLGGRIGNWAGNAAGRLGGAIGDKFKQGASWLAEKKKAGLEWLDKTGIVGAAGGFLKKGFSMIKTAASYTPLGMMAKGAYKLWKSGPVQKLWGNVKSGAAKAWGGIKKAGAVASKFLQSPAGQLLVTGLSLAASFIPGGMVVKGLVGAGIGALTAISEGKDWKHIALAAGSGALTAMVPFAGGVVSKLAMGAGTGALSAAMDGGGIKGMLKGAAGGLVDAFEPKMLHGLLNSKTLKLIKGGGKLEKIGASLLGGKGGKMIGGLEQAFANPKMRRVIGGLEKTGSKVIKGGIWVSGKAGKVQGVLDKVVDIGDKVDGALTQVHDYAPAVANFFGKDSAVGKFVNKAGDYAGQGEEKLHAALEYGHKASDTLTTYRGYLDKGLNMVGVKDPAKAYEKMQARNDAKKGKKGGDAALAKLMLEKHNAKHDAPHKPSHALAEASGKHSRGARGERKPRGERRPLGEQHHPAPHGAEHHAKGHGHEPGRPHGKRAPRKHQLGKLEQAIARGRALAKKGVKVAQKVHDGLGKAHEVLEKGLAGAQKVQGALEKAQELAKQGANYFGEDSELGAFLAHASERAEQMHGYLEQGISFTEGLNEKIDKAHGMLEHVPGVHGDEEGGESEGEEGGHGKGKKGKGRGRKGKGGAHGDSPLHHATHLEHGGGGAHHPKHGLGENGGEHGHPSHGGHGHPGAHGRADPHGKGKHAKPEHKTHGPEKHKDPHETPEQRKKRGDEAWQLVGNLSRLVQNYEKSFNKGLAKAHELSKKGGEQNAIHLIFIDLGGECDQVNQHIKKCKVAAKGMDSLEKEIKFYEEWHAKAKAKIYGYISHLKTSGDGKASADYGMGKMGKVSEAEYPDVFALLRTVSDLRTQVTALGNSVDEPEAKKGVERILGIAKAAKKHFEEMKKKYRIHPLVKATLEQGGHTQSGFEWVISRLEKSEKKHDQHESEHGKHDTHGKHEAPKKHHDLKKSVEHGLKALESFKKKANKAGRKLDHKLGHLEGLLKKGIKAGNKIDHGLHKASELATKLGDALGDDSPIGHLAHQAGKIGDKAHEKMHATVGMLKQGQKGLHKGRELLEQALGKHIDKQDKHVEHVEKHPAHKGHGHPHGELPEHAHHAAHGKHPEHGKHPHGKHPEHGKHPHHAAHGKHPHGHHPHGHHPHAQHGKHTHHGKHPHGHKPHPHHAHVEQPHPEHEAPSKPAQVDPAEVVASAEKALQAFAQAVSKGIPQIQKQMSSADTKGAASHVGAISNKSEHARTEITRAIAASSGKHTGLHKKALTLRTHYLEIRKAFFDFVSTLHGLSGDLGANLDPKKHKDVIAALTEVETFGVKVSALGDLKHADSKMQDTVKELTRQGHALLDKLEKLKKTFGKDEKALGALDQGLGKLSGYMKMLGAHGDKASEAKGDKELEIHEAKQQQKGRRKKTRRGRKPHRHGEHQHDMVGELLSGIEDGRIFVDRGSNRGDIDQGDGQDIDPSAMDTWIGSGEGAKLFSEVFGAFLPAEGAPSKGGSHLQHKQHGSGGAGGGAAHAGAAGGVPHEAHGELVHHGMGLLPDHAGGGEHGLHGMGELPVHHGMGLLPDPHSPHGKHGGKGHRGGKHGRGKGHKGKHRGAHAHVGGGGAGGHVGFFGQMFGKLHGFADELHHVADGVHHASEMGEGLLGKGMHLLEEGMHGLNVVEHAAEKVEGFAGKAEGFLDKMHLGKLAHAAHEVGAGAHFVDEKSKLLHGYGKKADKLMGEAKHGLHSVTEMSGKAGGMLGKASGIFAQAEHGHLGAFLHMFKASRFGDGIDGRRTPEKVRMGGAMDEPRRLDLSTMSQMSGFLGGDFSGVRLHTGQGAAEVTKRFDAEAVTIKDHIFFAPGKFNTQTSEGQKLLAHELTHVLQKNRPNLDVRTAESEALHSEHSYIAPQMETLNLSQPSPDFKLPDGEGLGAATGIHTAKRTRSKGHEAGGKDDLPDGDDFIEQVSSRVYELLMEELEANFESR